MAQIEIKNGTRVVVSVSNGFSWSSRLYVNGGETATLVCAKHKTEAGVRRWAEKVFSA